MLGFGHGNKIKATNEEYNLKGHYWLCIWCAKYKPKCWSEKKILLRVKELNYFKVSCKGGKEAKSVKNFVLKLHAERQSTQS